jgi:hypothetical protein
MELAITFAFAFLLGNAFMVMVEYMAKKHIENEEEKK